MKLIDELDGRIRDELAYVKAFTLNAQEVELIEPSAPLASQEYFDKFPDSRFDTEECAKSLAYGRHTAAVFHAMRMMEKSVLAVARCLGIPDPVAANEKTWGPVLNKIKAEIDRRWPHNNDRQSGDGAVFESLYATLLITKNAWRNKTMHPSHKQTAEEAGRIVMSSASFLKELAERMDEDGLPLVET